MRERRGEVVPGTPAKGGWSRAGADHGADTTADERLTASFVGIERTYSGAIDWAPADAPALWVYHLHYFDDLPSSIDAVAPEWKARLIERWIEENPPIEGAGWDPYPTSRRIANWTRWILEGGPGELLEERMLQSLALQARHLERNLEYHLLGNHLLANAKGLVAAGLLFAGEEGEQWLDRGLSLLEQELDYQVLEDGGHIERSPMYHAVLLDDLLDLLNLLRASGEARHIAEGLIDGAASMLDWLAAMSHPDGGPAFFNDTAKGAAPTLAELAGYALRLGVRWRPSAFPSIHTLDPSGYVRLASRDGRTVVFFDAAGPIGPNEQPGHGHADALSFEVSRDGHRLFVNSGVSTYGRTPERLAERGTAAHNTARIDGVEQSEVWASHRVGRRARPVRSGTANGTVFAAHDGYTRLPGRPVHERRLRLDDGALTVTDRFEGTGDHRLEWLFHLHPDCEGSVEGRNVLVRRAGRDVARLEVPEGVEVSVTAGLWHPGFHTSLENLRIVGTADATLPAAFGIAIHWLD